MQPPCWVRFAAAPPTRRIRRRSVSASAFAGRASGKNAAGAAAEGQSHGRCAAPPPDRGGPRRAYEYWGEPHQLVLPGPQTARRTRTGTCRRRSPSRSSTSRSSPSSSSAPAAQPPRTSSARGHPTIHRDLDEMPASTPRPTARLASTTRNRRPRRRDHHPLAQVRAEEAGPTGRIIAAAEAEAEADASRPDPAQDRRVRMQAALSPRP